MSLLTDADYIIHKMRYNLLQGPAEDIRHFISFPAQTLSDYVSAAFVEPGTITASRGIPNDLSHLTLRKDVLSPYQFKVRKRKGRMDEDVDDEDLQDSDEEVTDQSPVIHALGRDVLGDETENFDNKDDDREDEGEFDGKELYELDDYENGEQPRRRLKNPKPPNEVKKITAVGTFNDDSTTKADPSKANVAGPAKTTALSLDSLGVAPGKNPTVLPKPNNLKLPLTSKLAGSVDTLILKPGPQPYPQVPKTQSTTLNDSQRIPSNPTLGHRIIRKIEVGPAIVPVAGNENQAPPPQTSAPIPAPIPAHAPAQAPAPTSLTQSDSNSSTPKTRRIENLFVKHPISGAASPLKIPVIRPLAQATAVGRQSGSSLFDELTREKLAKPKSLLSEMIREKIGFTNPFAAEFALMSGKGDSDSIKMKTFYPFSQNALKPLQIFVRKDASVNDAIGLALYQYVEEKREPLIPDKLARVWCWNLRIVEDDGEIDEDFPALDRNRKIQKFAFDQFGLCEATSEQMRENEALGTKLLSTRTLAPTQVPPLPNMSSSVSLMSLTNVQSPSSGINPGGPMIFLKVNLYSTLEIKQSTMMPIVANMLMSDVFEVICRKRKYESKDYVLRLADTKTGVPLDRTLGELGITEVCVLKKDRGGAGDIFLRPPDEVKQDDDLPPNIASNELTLAYKQYAVIHKHLMGRHERFFTIDGDYIHVVAAGDRNFFDLMKTATHDINTVVSCKQLKKNGPAFKLVIQNGNDMKLYDLEAISAQEAYEICTKINFLVQYRKKDVS